LYFRTTGRCEHRSSYFFTDVDTKGAPVSVMNSLGYLEKAICVTDIRHNLSKVR